MMRMKYVCVCMVAILFAPWTGSVAQDANHPCTPINATSLPLTITTSGTYCLSQSISTTGGGITIAVDNVTIDLRGFSLSGGTGNGIGVSGSRSNLVVMNGVVSNWGLNGIDFLGAGNTVVSNVVALSNGTLTRSIGIRTGLSSTVRNSVARFNTLGGITAQGNASIENCDASNNGTVGFTSAGIEINDVGVVSGCLALGNIGGPGIRTGQYTVVKHCSAVANGSSGFVAGNHSRVLDSTSQANGDDGITGSPFSEITGCVASNNANDGIQCGEGCYVANNLARGNGASTLSGAGIHVTGSGSRIEANNAISNDIGVLVDAPGNTIFRNSARGNLPDYAIVAGNDTGPIGTAAVSVSPWANIIF